MPVSSVRSFTDPGEYSSSFRDFQYELTVTGGGAFEAEHARIGLHKVLLQWYHSDLPWVAHTEIVKGRATFALRATPGPSLLRAGQEMLTTNIERLASGQELYTRSLGTVSWGTISVPADALATIGEATAGCNLKPPVDVVTQTPAPAAMARLLRLHAAAVSLAKQAPEIIANAESARGLEHEIVQALIACLRPIEADEDVVARRQHALVMRRFHSAVTEVAIVPSTCPICVRRSVCRIGRCRSVAANIWGWVLRNISGYDGCSTPVTRSRSPIAPTRQ